jgi:hypothetical protein
MGLSDTILTRLEAREFAPTGAASTAAQEKTRPPV